MQELGDAAIVLVCLLGCSGIGWYARPLLSEHHRTRETTELVQLVVTMLVTFAALVLGLQTNSIKGDFDQVSNQLKTYSIELIQLDVSLRDYGTGAADIRNQLRSYTASAIANTWLEEPPPPGDYYPHPAQRSRAEAKLQTTYLGNTLLDIQDQIRGLQPPDPKHARLQADALRQIGLIVAERWRIIEAGSSSVSTPFYLVLIFWLGIVFAAFGLSAPRHLLAYVTICLAALSIASVVFVMLDLDTPFDGFFFVSSQPMRGALEHMLN